MLIYAVFLAFMVVGFVGALFRSLTLFKSVCCRRQIKPALFLKKKI